MENDKDNDSPESATAGFAKERFQDMKLKEVARVWGGMEADIIKGFLESQGIACLLQGRILNSLYPISMDGLGEIRVFVAEDDYETAKKLLEERE